MELVVVVVVLTYSSGWLAESSCLQPKTAKLSKNFCVAAFQRKRNYHKLLLLLLLQF